MSNHAIARVYQDAADRVFAANSPELVRAANDLGVSPQALSLGARQKFGRLLSLGVGDDFANGLPPDVRRDAQTLAASARQLEYLFTQLYEEPMPDLKMAEGEIIEINREVPDGAKTFTWYTYTGRSMARFVEAWGHGNAPGATIQQAQQSGVTKNIENEYSFTMQDLRHAGFAGIPLEAMLAKADKRAHKRLANDTGLWGREDIGLPGLVLHPNINVVDAPLNAGATSRNWSLKSAAEILADIATLVNTTGQSSFGMRRTTHVWLPRFEHDLIAQMLVTTLATMTVLEWAKKVHPGVEFGILDELAATQSTDQNGTQHLATDAAISLVKTSEIVSLVVPMEYIQHAPQYRSLRVIVPTESMTGGVILREPPTVLRMDQIGAT